MSIQAHEAFDLFLTALRNAGVDVPHSDRGVARLIADALSEINEEFADESEVATAESLRAELHLMVTEKLLADDNGN